MKKAVLFDLDGTLWDFSQGCANAWNEVLKQKGLSPITPDAMESVMGLPMDVLAQKLFGDIPEVDRQQLMKECETYENVYVRQHGGELFAGVENLLKRLHKKYKIGIISNCQTGYIEAFIDHYGLQEVIDYTRSYGDSLREKAENIRDVLEENQIDQAVYIGDIYNDWISAEQANIPFILAAYGFGAFDYPLKVDSIDAIEDLVDALLNQKKG